MAFNSLRPIPHTRISTLWGNAIVDALNQLYDLGMESVKYYDLEHLGYDIIPEEDNKLIIGDPEHEFKTLYSHYGYFSDNVFIQGKRALKDGDPINLYDIFEPAKEKITESIDESTATQYLRDIREKVVKLEIDEYGRVGVIIAEPIDEYGRVRTSVESDFRPVYNRASVSSSDNTYGLEVGIFSNGRPNVNLYYKLGAAGDIYVEVSLDGVTWRTLDHISLSSAGEDIKTYQGIAYPYVRARVPTTGIDVELELVASR